MNIMPSMIITFGEVVPFDKVDFIEFKESYQEVIYHFSRKSVSVVFSEKNDFEKAIKLFMDFKKGER